jgi:hypothetical protein
MSVRGRLAGYLVIVCVAILWGVSAQRTQLAGLRAEQRQMLVQMAMLEGTSASPGTAEAASAGSATVPASLVPAPELLRLRNEVTRLTERRRELAGVRAENEQLRAQLAARGTNDPGKSQPPAGYVFKSQARFIGYNTPEAAVQSMLWAVRNHDMTNLLQAFTPEAARKIQGELALSRGLIEQFFGLSADVPGVRVMPPDNPDFNTGFNTNTGQMWLQLEFVPGLSGTRIPLRQTNSQWKLDWLP